MTTLEIELGECYTWGCFCQDTLVSRSECVHLRSALAALGCDDAAVRLTSVNYKHFQTGQPYGRFVVDRALTNTSIKLRGLPNEDVWRLSVQCRLVDPNSSDYYHFSSWARFTPDGDKIEDGRTATASAFGKPVRATSEVLGALHWSPTFVSEVLQAAESFGLTHRDVLCSRSGNFLHNWADFDACSRPDLAVSEMLASVQLAVEPHDYRQLLSERDDNGETPYEVAARYHGATSEVARLFQLTGPKSAAGGE